MRTDLRIPAGRATLAAEMRGKRDDAGPMLVCLHAGVCDRRMWRSLGEVLARRHPVVAYDRRGFGETPATDEARSQVDDLFAVLDHPAVRGAPAVLVGCSQGGRVAIDAALAAPDRVAALVLIAPAVSGAPDPDAFPAPIQALVEQVEAAERAEDVERLNALEARIWLDGPLSAEGRVGGPLRDLLLEMNGIALRAAPMPSLVEPPSAYERLQQLAPPTAVIWGDLDFPHIVGRCREIARRVRGAEAHEVQGAAHLPTMEQPERCAALIGAFLDRVLLAPGKR